MKISLVGCILTTSLATVLSGCNSLPAEHSVSNTESPTDPIVDHAPKNELAPTILSAPTIHDKNDNIDIRVDTMTAETISPSYFGDAHAFEPSPQSTPAEQHTIAQEPLLVDLADTIYFPTGEDQLTDQQQSDIRALAEFLQENPATTIALTGHSDPRGTEEYNNVLSIERAKTIQNLLVELGIEQSRIHSEGLGSVRSSAEKGDHNAYAKDRRVDINLIQPELENFAQF